MILKDLSDWCALLDALQSRGAMAINVTAQETTIGDRAVTLLTGIQCTLSPRLQAGPTREAPMTRPVPDGEDKPPAEPLPAGLGYTEL